MAQSDFFRRLRTYLFGVAIGCLLVAMLFIARANSAGQRQAAGHGPAPGGPSIPSGRP